MKLDRVNLQGDKVSIGLTAVLAVILTLQMLPKDRDREDAAVKPIKDMVMKDRPRHVSLKSVILPAPPPPKKSLVAVPQVSFKKIAKKAVVAGPTPTMIPPTAKREASQKTVKVDTVQAEMLQEGRVLLKLLEVGKGPNVEIAWPTQPQQREVLYRTLARCYGLQSGIMNAKGQIYVATGKLGEPVTINSDQVSPFLRQSAGQLSGSEKGILTNIRQRHGLINGQPVRLFNRNVDAALLGALFRLVPGNMSDSPQIRASYGLTDKGIGVQSVIVDGNPVAGQVDVGFSLLGKCR